MKTRNADIRSQIKALYASRHGMSYGSIDYQRITKEIEVLSLQLDTDHHWSASPGFVVAIIAAVAGCIAAYPVVRSWLAEPAAPAQESDGKAPKPLAPAKSQSQNSK